MYILCTHNDGCINVGCQWYKLDLPNIDSTFLGGPRAALGVSQYVSVHSKMKWAPPHGRCVLACQAATPLIPVSPGCLLSLQVVTELFSVVIQTFLAVTGFPDENYMYTS